MTNGREEPQTVGEALDRLRDLRGRMAPRGRAGGEQTGGESSRNRAAHVVDNRNDVASQGRETARTGGELPEEDGEEARDVESLVDDRIERRGRDLRSTIRGQFADFKTEMLKWGAGILVTGLLGVGTLYYAMGSDWKSDVLRSLENLRQEIRADIREIREAGQARESEIDRLEERTDSLTERVTQ